MRLILFDVDGTLIAGESSERRFMRYLIRCGRMGPRQATAQLYFLARYGSTYGRHVFKKNKGYLTGLLETQVAGYAETFVRTRLLHGLFPASQERLRAHQAAGDTVVLLTGTPEFIAMPLARSLGVEHVYATHCQTRNGRFRLAPPARHPFAAEKVVMAQRIARRFDVPLRQVVAYADAIDDLPLLASVGEAVAVLPDSALRQAASARGWEVLDDDSGFAYPG